MYVYSNQEVFTNHLEWIAYIIANLFGYSVKIVSENVAQVGFPLSSVYKVKGKLEEKKINYMIIDPRNEYNIDEVKEFNNLNTYENEFKKSYSANKHRKWIRKICEEMELLMEKPNFKEIIRKVEDVLDESGEI